MSGQLPESGWPGPAQLAVYFGREDGELVRVFTGEEDAIAWMSVPGEAKRTLWRGKCTGFAQVQVVRPRPFLQVTVP